MEVNNETGVEIQPVNNTKELFKNALFYGLMLAGSLILLDLLNYTFNFSGLGMIFGIIMPLVILSIYIGFFVWAGRKYRNKYYGGHINYGKAFLFCLLMALVSLIVLTLYYYIFYNFFDPERAANEIQVGMSVIESNQYFPDDKKEEILTEMSQITTGKIVMQKMASSAFWCLILAAISALFVRKKVKITEVY